MAARSGYDRDNIAMKQAQQRTHTTQQESAEMIASDHARQSELVGGCESRFIPSIIVFNRILWRDSARQITPPRLSSVY